MAEPKPKSTKPKGPWLYRWEQNVKNMFRGIWEIVRTLRSQDPASRKMAFIFVVSLVAALSVVVVSIRHVKKLRSERAQEISRLQEDAKKLNDFFEKQATEAKRKYSSAHLGRFFVELKEPQTLYGAKSKKVLWVAEIEVIAECDQPSTCDFLENNLTAVKDALTTILVPIERDEFLSKEGKDRLKKTILDHLNSWIESNKSIKGEKGKIRNLYFPKLLLS